MIPEIEGEGYPTEHHPHFGNAPPEFISEEIQSGTTLQSSAPVAEAALFVVRMNWHERSVPFRGSRLEARNCRTNASVPTQAKPDP
jgi:hypothetical protein